ncbi:MAG: glycosyltransferase [Desulfobacterales bacterium]
MLPDRHFMSGSANLGDKGRCTTLLKLRWHLAMALTKNVGSDSDALPLISIIVPVLNSGKMLKNFIGQIKSQTYKKIQLIIIDGGSQDHTKEILQSMDQTVDFWLSEPDHGIYDAMNKGIDAARGEWLFFSGVDDCFACPEILETLFAKGRIAPGTQLICGNVLRGDGKITKAGLIDYCMLKTQYRIEAFIAGDLHFATYRYGCRDKFNECFIKCPETPFEFVSF